MSEFKKEELLTELKREILNVVLESDGDYGRMNVNKIIYICSQLQCHTQATHGAPVHPLASSANLSLNEFEDAQDSIYARMNSLRM